MAPSMPVGSEAGHRQSLHNALTCVHNVRIMRSSTALTASLRDRSPEPGRERRPAGRQAVDRALTVLSLFDERRRSLTVSDVAARLAVHRSTASRLLAGLQTYGLVDYDDRERCYRPGLGLVSLAGLALNRFPGRALARRALFALRDRTGESTHLSVLDHTDVVYLEQASTVHAQVDIDWVGLRQPAVASTSGRLLLAFADRDAPPRGPASPADIVAWPDRPSADELATTRERGYLARTSLRGVEGEPMAGVAAAIRHPHNGDVYALAVGGPVRRVSPDRLIRELVPQVRHAAAQVCEQFGELA